MRISFNFKNENDLDGMGMFYRKNINCPENKEETYSTDPDTFDWLRENYELENIQDSDTPCPHCGGFGPATGGGEPGYEDEPCHAPFVSEEYRRRNPCSGCPADADRSVCLSTMAAGNCPLP